jgi:zinc protease
MTSTLVNFSSLPRLNFPTVRQLPNGLTVVAEQMPVEAVNLSIWANVGSAIESDPINGMAHFLEHMVFKGTEQLASGEFERQIEERGAITNAATSQDYTYFYITCAPKDFADLAPLQVDVVVNPSIPDEAFERERLVVLEEIRRAQDNPRRRTYYRSMETAFDVLPYRRKVLGPAEAVAALTPQQMRDFHATWYRPRSLTAVAVGNLPVEELIDGVAESFDRHYQARSPRQDDRAIAPVSHEPESPFETVVRREFVDESLQQARLVMMWRVPGAIDFEDTYALDVLASILGRGRTTRLIQDLREEKGWVSGLSVSNMSHRWQGTFYISAQLPSENIEKVEEAILGHLRQIAEEGVTPAEINRIRTQVANRFIFSNETPSDRASLYGYYQSMLGDLTPALNYPARIQAVTSEDLQQAARQYLSPQGYGVVVMKPTEG